MPSTSSRIRIGFIFPGKNQFTEVVTIYWRTWYLKEIKTGSHFSRDTDVPLSHFHTNNGNYSQVLTQVHIIHFEQQGIQITPVQSAPPHVHVSYTTEWHPQHSSRLIYKTQRCNTSYFWYQTPSVDDYLGRQLGQYSKPSGKPQQTLCILTLNKIISDIYFQNNTTSSNDRECFSILCLWFRAS